MHRFVLVVSPFGFAEEEHDLLAQFTESLSDWSPALNSRFARAWVEAKYPSRLSYRSLSSPDLEGCLIGRDFPRTPNHEASAWAEGILLERWGAFVTVSVDHRTGVVRVLRDPSGRVNCWCYSSGDTHLYFSHLDDVLPHIEASLTIDWEFLLFYASNKSLHGSRTGYVEITELLPGQEIAIEKNGISYATRWSQQRLLRLPFASTEVALKNIRQSAEEAVAAWAGLYEHISLDLSGGLDSAIVLGLLRKSADHPHVVGVNWTARDDWSGCVVS